MRSDAHDRDIADGSYQTPLRRVNCGLSFHITFDEPRVWCASGTTRIGDDPIRGEYYKELDKSCRVSKIIESLAAKVTWFPKFVQLLWKPV